MGEIHIPVKVSRPGGGPETFEGNFLVDTGATDSLVPARELRRLGVEVESRRNYELAAGSEHEYARGIARLEFLGTRIGGNVLFGPDEAEPILGVTALESAGVVIDPEKGTLTIRTALLLK